MAINNKKSINEHINRIKFLSGYQLNEAKYSLVDNMDEDDTIPDDIFKSVQPISGVDSNVHEDEGDGEEGNTMPDMGAEEAPLEEPAPEVPMEEPPVEEPVEDMGMGSEEPAPMEQPSVEDIQNDILKKSVSAMQKMNDQLQNLENTLASFDQKMAGLNKEVEEVREPTNVEKLVARKQDSHPFYMNLDDMWNGNSFQARRQIDHSNGIKQLEDGTYIADFDSLPKYSEQEIKDSFRESKISKKKIIRIT